MSLKTAIIEEISPGPLWRLRFEDGFCPSVFIPPSASDKLNSLFPGHTVQVGQNNIGELHIIDGDATPDVSVELRCSACRQPVAKPVTTLNISIDAHAALHEEPLIPSGTCWTAPHNWPSFGSGQLILNLEDLLNTKPHPEIKRFFGCCGISGYQGINTFCECGHELGTLSSDCCDPYYFAIRENGVIISLAK